ncbi:MAG: hypothetical protein ABIL09_19770 [Gemmatimonadota bacterium]
MKTCATYEEYGQGAIDEERFAAHVRTCPTCRHFLEEDKRLLAGAAELRPVARPGGDLWAGVEGALDRARWKRTAWRYARVAAVLVVGLGIWHLVPDGDPGSSLLLGGDALTRVEQAERQYVEAIEALEVEVTKAQPGQDGELQALFADRLAAIDAQIARCRAAARQNPGNAQVRRYLLAALQEKEATLRQMRPQGGGHERGEANHDRG